MADVARLAGVSVSTVSYAMTGTRPITPATRERVERAMRELGYTPNALARGLKTKRSKIIALLYPPFPGRGLDLSGLGYILGAADHAQESGYHLLLWTTTEVDALSDLARFAGQGLIDGALMMEVKLRDERVKVLTDARLPFVMIGRTEDTTGIDFADTDFEQCTRTAVGISQAWAIAASASSIRLRRWPGRKWVTRCGPARAPFAPRVRPAPN